MATKAKRDKDAERQMKFDVQMELYQKFKILFDLDYRWHPTRRWELDFANPKTKVAIEIDGGAFVSGGHTRGQAFINDLEKHRELTLLGWRVLRYPPNEVGTVMFYYEIEQLLKLDGVKI